MTTGRKKEEISQAARALCSGRQAPSRAITRSERCILCFFRRGANLFCLAPLSLTNEKACTHAFPSSRGRPEGSTTRASAACSSSFCALCSPTQSLCAIESRTAGKPVTSCGAVCTPLPKTRRKRPGFVVVVARFGRVFLIARIRRITGAHASAMCPRFSSFSRILFLYPPLPFLFCRNSRVEEYRGMGVRSSPKEWMAEASVHAPVLFLFFCLRTPLIFFFLQRSC